MDTGQKVLSHIYAYNERFNARFLPFVSYRDEEYTLYVQDFLGGDKVFHVTFTDHDKPKEVWEAMMDEIIDHYRATGRLEVFIDT